MLECIVRLWKFTALRILLFFHGQAKCSSRTFSWIGIAQRYAVNINLSYDVFFNNVFDILRQILVLSAEFPSLFENRG